MNVPEASFTKVDFPETAAAPNYRLSLLCLLLIKAALMGYFIIYGSIGLGPDEAQYWTWSQDLDWGYYSKPPAIAWSIALGTYFLGNTELGVRFAALVIAILLPYSVYMLARAVGLKRPTAFWAGVVMATSPMGILASFLATTDAPYVVFWTLALAVLLLDLREGRMPHYGWIGCALFFGALFKWAIFFFWLVVLLIAWVYPRCRTWRIGLGIAISLLALVPSIIWNSANDWATFRHVWQTNLVGRDGGAISWNPFGGNPLDFTGAQIALLSPVFFVLFVLAFRELWLHRTKISRAIRWCGYLTVIILSTYLFLSLFKKIQGNWCIFAYPSAMVLLCWYTCERLHGGRPWLFFGVVTSVFITTMTLMLPGYQKQTKNPWIAIPFKSSPFKHNVGWEQLEQDLKAIAFNPNRQFLFGSRYGTSSILSFYNEAHARAYFLNIEGQRKNQFSYWPSMAQEEMGNTGFYVTVEQGKQLDGDLAASVGHYERLLTPYFDEVHFLGRYPLFHAYDRVAKTALIYQCVGYNGKVPEETQIY